LSTHPCLPLAGQSSETAKGVHETAEIVLLRGSSLLHADTLVVIATLDAEGVWRTPDGVVTDAIGVPRQSASAIVKPEAQKAAHREQDAKWVNETLGTVREIAERQQDMTVDDVWAAVKMPPRKQLVMSPLMVAAARAGMIEQTNDHRPSARPFNGGRQVRVWRSLINTAGPDGQRDTACPGS